MNSMKTSDYGLTSYSDYYNTNKIRVKLTGGFLKQDWLKLLHGGILNVYEIIDNFSLSNYPILNKYLIGAAKLTKNAGNDKSGHSSYGTGFDRHDSFFTSFWTSGGTGRYFIIFGVDTSSSTNIDNRKKDKLIFAKCPTQGLEHTLSAEKMYPIKFIEKKKNCLSLHYDKETSYLFVYGTGDLKFKSRDSEFLNIHYV